MKANPPTSPPLAAARGLEGPESEAAWIDAARRGDRQAFGRLVELHQDAVMTTAYYMAGNREDAEDISQESFLRAYRALGSFAGQSSFRTWLLTITTNAARSHSARRRAKKRSAAEVRIHDGTDDEPIEVPEPDGRSSPDGFAERVELKERLEGAIAALDEESRAVIVLRDLAGESYEAIGEALGLPVGTVKSRIHRARLELRQRLQDLL